MSFKSKRTMSSMVAGVLLIIAYVIYATGNRAPTTENLNAWAVSIIIFIGIGVVVTIVIMILFHITYAIGIAARNRELDNQEIDRIISSATIEDEMEKLISLKSNKVSQIINGMGLLAFLIVLATGGAVVLALHVLLGLYVFGSFVEGGVNIYLYERGVSNG